MGNCEILGRLVGTSLPLNIDTVGAFVPVGTTLGVTLGILLGNILGCPVDGRNVLGDALVGDSVDGNAEGVCDGA